MIHVQKAINIVNRLVLILIRDLTKIVYDNAGFFLKKKLKKMQKYFYVNKKRYIDCNLLIKEIYLCDTSLLIFFFPRSTSCFKDLLFPFQGT